MIARKHHFSALSLIEILVAIAIIAVLAFLLFPVFSRTKMDSLNAKCISNLRNIHTAWASYASDNGGRLMRATTGQGPWYEDYWTKDLHPYLGFSKPPEGHLEALVNTVAFCPLNNGGTYHRTECSALSYIPNALIGGAYNSAGNLHESLLRWPSNRVPVATTIGAIQHPSARMLFACARENIVRTFFDAENVEPYLANSYNSGGNILYADGHISLYRPSPDRAGEAIALVLGPGK